MNPLVKKEIRLLLPAWITANLLAIIPFWIASVWSRVPPEANLYVELAFGFGALFLSIASFGEEFSSGAFSILLSQPMERRRIWLIKTTVLGIAFVSVLLALAVSWQLDFFIRTARKPDFLTEFGFPALFVAVIFSSGLWTTLLLRRTLEAFWITLLTPLAIMVTLYAFHEYFHWSNQTDNYVIPTVLLLYSLVGFFWARRLFFRAQDVQWTGGEFVFPSRKKASQRTTVSYRPRYWLSALVWKEFQLHQVNILIAVGVLALNLTSVVIRKFHPHFTDPKIQGWLELVWVLWLLMPLLIGSAAVAEEHRVCVRESQLCLPVSRRAQFVVKFFVALALSLVLGGVMPFIIEWTRDFSGIIFVVAAIIFFISFYASTVARTTIQAIGLAIIVAVTIYFFEVATAFSAFAVRLYLPNNPVGLEILKLYLGVPILVLVLLWLMYWNFKWLHSEGKLRWRNGIAFLAALAFIFVCTNTIYFRAWELLTPVEPPHGTARLHDARAVKFAANWNTIYAILPDGKLWTDTLTFDVRTNHWLGGWETIALSKGKIRLISNSNWIGVAADGFQAVGIQSNGSLWSVQRQWNPSQPRLWQTGPFNSNRIASETNWSQVASGRGDGFLLLKRDGSLWIWGTNGYDWNDASNSIPRKLKLDLTTPPALLSQQTDWSRLFSAGLACAKKTDGSLWWLPREWHNSNQVYEIVLATNLNEQRLNLGIYGGGGSSVGIKTNGELWFFWEDWSHNKPIPRKIQLGQNTKWKTAAFTSWDSFVAIRSDGTLWKWSGKLDWSSNSPPMIPVQLGYHSDWVAFATAETFDLGAFVLSADGNLWIWDQPSGHVWLAPSRKPVYLGNIFKATN